MAGSSDIERALHTYLTSTSPSSTAIADVVGKRIFFAEAEEHTARPYVVFNVISDPHVPFAFGEANSGQPRVQFSVFHENRYSALTAARVIRKKLRHFSGTMDSMTIHKLDVTGTLLFRDPEQDVFQATFDALPIYIDAS